MAAKVILSWLAAEGQARRGHLQEKGRMEHAPLTTLQQISWDIAAIVGEFLQYRFVQPYVHLCRITHLFGGAMQFRGQLLARCQAAVETQKLHQINDGDLPAEFFCMRLGKRFQVRYHVDDADAGRSSGVAAGSAAAAAASSTSSAASTLSLPKPNFVKILLNIPILSRLYFIEKLH